MPHITTTRGQLFFTDHRKADSPYIPVIYIHGAGGSHLDWAIELRRLPQANAIALDLPGHGKSAPPHRTTIADYAHDVIAFIDALALPKVILAGHSMGGAITQYIALTVPDKLAGMMLIGTGAKLAVHPDILSRVQTDYAGVADLLSQWLWSETASEELRHITKQQLLKTPAQVTYGDYLACNGFDMRDKLAEIQTRALVISGTHDKMTPPKYGEYLATHLPNATFALIEDVGHMLMLENPLRMAQLIVAWLEGA